MYVVNVVVVAHAVSVAAAPAVSAKMKITRKQLNEVLSEEIQRHLELEQFNEDVRMAYAEHILLTYPTILLSEGFIDHGAYSRATKMQMLNESGDLDSSIQEGFFDDVKKLAKQVGGKALEKGKGLGKAALKKAKEVGDTEIDTKQFSKDAGRVGKEAGEMAAGAASGIWNALAPMAKKLGGGAMKFAKDTASAVEKNLPGALDTVKKVVGDAASAGAGAVGDTAAGLAGMIEKAKEGLSLEQQAKKDPASFLTMYGALQKKLDDMGVPAKTPQQAAATLGIFQSPDGQKALAHGAKKAGVTPAELESLVATYVFQSKYVDMASKAKASMKESRSKLKSHLSKIIRESITREQHLSNAYDSGMTDSQEGYDPGSYHEWIDGDQELMSQYDKGFEDGKKTPSKPMPGRREELQKTYGDMDVGVRGKAGY